MYVTELMWTISDDMSNLPHVLCCVFERTRFLRPYTDSENTLLWPWTDPSLIKEKENRNKNGEKEIRRESVENYEGALLWELIIQAFAFYAFA
jgi:hypothetical protein